MALARFLLCITAALAAAPLVATAQPFPLRPVRMVVPFAPGGISDLLARILSRKLGENFGQSIVIDNRPGAGGNVGTELAAKADANGYTLLFCSPSFAISPCLYRKIGYVPLRDFAPVAQMASATNLLVVTPGVPAQSVRDLIAIARARPGKLDYGSGGVGTSGQLAAELLKISADVNIVHIPYKGAGPAVTALLAGEVQVMFSPVPLVLPYVKSARLRALAVTSAKRVTVLPDIPAIAESGFPGFDVTSWWGVVAPARTPTPIIDRLYREVGKIVQQPETVSQISSQGAEATLRSPAEFTRYIGEEIKKWANVIQKAGITND